MAISYDYVRDFAPEQTIYLECDCEDGRLLDKELFKDLPVEDIRRLKCKKCNARIKGYFISHGLFTTAPPSCG